MFNFRRLDATVSFYDQTWAAYKNGFGAVTGSHWLGNDKIHTLSTKDSSVTLRIEIRGDRCQQATFPGSCASSSLIDPNVYIFGEFRSYVRISIAKYFTIFRA